MRDVPDYVLRTAHVLDDVGLVYVPVPKAGSTAILRALAELEGIDPDTFTRSRKLEATRALAVHDGSLWGPTHRLAGRSATEVESILGSDDWFRFTVVREPARRVWSAWVSKVLVRDPRFVAVFGEDWFPAVPTGAGEILDSFRLFVRSLRDGPRPDAHWAPQTDLLGWPAIPFRHTGRVESLDATVAAVDEHLRPLGRPLPPLGHENRAILPFAPELFDAPARVACDAWTASDREAFGYEPLEETSGEPARDWLAAVEATIPALQAVIERNTRVGDLHRLLAEQRPG
jgi:hypothetical protein